MAPVETRIAAGDAPGGFIARSGVDHLKSALKGNATLFAEWRREPMTRAVADALRHLAAHPPKDAAPDQLLVQCGFTEGLQLALQLVDDPSAVWPGVFGDDAKPLPPPPTMDFNTSIDDMLGK